MYGTYKFLQETGLEASDPGLTSGFTMLFKNQTISHATAKKTDTDYDVPVCILVELSQKRPKLSRLRYKARLIDNGIPEDILTKLHICPTQTKKRGQQT